MAARASHVSDPERFRRLPPTVPRELLRTSEESNPVPDEKLDELREIEWMLRGSSGG